MNDVLSVQNLQKRYGGAMALDGFSMQIPAGAIYGFVGRNGAGKTTLIRTVCGLAAPDGGDYALFGVSRSDRGIAAKRRRVGAMIDAPAVYGNMTADENLRQIHRILGLPSFAGIGELLRLVGLEETGRKQAKHFSQGMKQKLGIAMALAGEPDFLILDEPVNGLDPQGVIELRNLIVRLNRERNVTFLISSHNLDELARLATHYGFVDHGRMVAQMTAAELAQVCKRSMRFRVSDIGGLQRALARMQVQYRVVSGTEADVFDPISITQLALALIEEGCELYACVEQDENLEAFFIELVGGACDA